MSALRSQKKDFKIVTLGPYNTQTKQLLTELNLVKSTFLVKETYARIKTVSFYWRISFDLAIN